MPPGEAWVPSVRKLVVRSDDERAELLGTVYLDLIQHPRKPASTEYCAAVRLTPPDYSAAGAAKVASVAVVCSALYPHRNMPAFFSYADLRGFLHEFGHALRVLKFSPRPAAEFLRLRPSRCRLVDEELHARLFERFAEDYDVVRRFAVHHESGDGLSRAQFDEWVRSFHYFGSLSQQLQLVRTLADLRFHGVVQRPENIGSTYLAAYHSSVLPHVAGVHPYLRDSSFVLQGGSLYAGVLAESRADELWSKHMRSRGGVSRAAVVSLFDDAAKQI
jgi:intermediate peptidase